MLCSPPIYDVFDLIESASSNGYDFVAPEIVG